MLTTTSRAQDRYISTDQRRYHYREWGDPTNPSMLILHGVTGHSWEFDRMADYLSDRFHIHVLDQRGHGTSEWASDYATDRMAEDVADVLAELEIDRMKVIGHSMGGIVGYLLAARCPELVDQLVVIDVGPDTVASDWGAATLDTMLGYYASTAYNTPDTAIEDYLRDTTGPKAEELRHFVLNNLRQMDDGRWTWRFDARGLHASFGPDMPSAELQWAALRSLSCPTLVVRGGLSEALSDDTARRIEQTLQNGDVVQIAEAGHDVHLDQFEALMAEVDQFLHAGHVTV